MLQCRGKSHHTAAARSWAQGNPTAERVQLYSLLQASHAADVVPLTLIRHPASTSRLGDLRSRCAMPRLCMCLCSSGCNSPTVGHPDDNSRAFGCPVVMGARLACTGHCHWRAAGTPDRLQDAPGCAKCHAEAARPGELRCQLGRVACGFHHIQQAAPWAVLCIKQIVEQKLHCSG